MNEPHER